jgi:hypothetical protein
MRESMGEGRISSPHFPQYIKSKVAFKPKFGYYIILFQNLLLIIQVEDLHLEICKSEYILPFSLPSFLPSPLFK